MEKNDKIIISFYILLIISFPISIIYFSNQFDIVEPPNLIPKAVTELELTKNVEIDRETIFNTMTSVNNYPTIIPKNIASVSILNYTKSEIFAEEELIESGIKTKLLVKHIIIPYDSHIIEILSGDASGTKIIQTFTGNDSNTTINTKIKLDLKGILTPFSFLPKSNLLHALDTVIQSFVDYSKSFKNEYQKTIDDLYREILLRPADNEGLIHFGNMLESGLITEDEIRNKLLESEERKSLYLTERKSIEELSIDTVKTIDDLYREILLRPADNEGLIHFGNMLESGLMTEDEIRLHLLNSNEGKSNLFNDPIRAVIAEMFKDILSSSPTSEELDQYQIMLKMGEITLEDIEMELLNSKAD